MNYLSYPTAVLALLCTAASIASASDSLTEFNSPRNPSPEVRNYGRIVNMRELHRNAERTPTAVIERILPGDVALEWHHGCTPTAVGMLMTFLDQNGYDSMVPWNDLIGSPSNGVLGEEAAASSEHYENYALPMDEGFASALPDKSQLGGAHQWNSVADFLNTSFSINGTTYGSTQPGRIRTGMEGYLKNQYPELWFNTYDFFVDTSVWLAAWDLVKTLIDNNLPIVAGVDSSGSGYLDHAILIVGYRESETMLEMIAYNTWDSLLHAYPFLPAYDDYYAQTFYNFKLGVGRIFPVVPQANNFRQHVQRFSRPDNGSYFFTANEEEAEAVKSSPHFEWDGVSHVVYSGKVLPETVPVYRFLNSKGSHFYTASPQERDSIIANLSHQYTLEGVAFYVLAGQVGGSQPVHRFYQPSTMSHFFTILPTEVEDRIANDPSLQYEGIAWYAFPN